MKQKKSPRILIVIVLLIIFVAFVIIDRIIIIRIRYDEGSFDGHYVDYPNDERLYILKGYGRNASEDRSTNRIKTLNIMLLHLERFSHPADTCGLNHLN